jgi:hypothetical protein
VWNGLQVTCQGELGPAMHVSTEEGDDEGLRCPWGKHDGQPESMGIAADPEACEAIVDWVRGLRSTWADRGARDDIK